jgi:hypothetical protein
VQLLYPLFVYCYLRTVQEKHGMHARDLLTSLKERFLQSESASVSVVKELEDLGAIVHHQHLQSNAAKEVCFLRVCACMLRRCAFHAFVPLCGLCTSSFMLMPIGLVQFMNGMTTIKLSKPSLELFMNFVQRREMWSLLAVCNECIRFDKQPNVMSSKDIRPLEGLRVKDTADEGAITNSQPVELGLLEGCLEDKLVELFLSGAMQVRPAPE